jgi:peptide chain release factor subunit 1
MNKHHHGGQSAQRFERLRDISIHDYYKKLAEICNEAFLNKNLSGIIIGGPAMTKDDFVNGELLNHELRKQVIGIVNTSYTDESGLSEAAKAAESVISETKYIQEKKVLDRFWEELRNDGKCIYGPDTKNMLSTGRIDTLIIADTYSVKELEDILTEAEQFKTEVMILSSDSESGSLFNKTFSIGGILRY